MVSVVFSWFLNVLNFLKNLTISIAGIEMPTLCIHFEISHVFS